MIYSSKFDNILEATNVTISRYNLSLLGIMEICSGYSVGINGGK
jgi:hypothetical protein